MRMLLLLLLLPFVSLGQVSNSSTPPAGAVQTQNTARLDGNYPVLYFGQYAGFYRFAYPITTATNQFPFTITRSAFTVGKVINTFDDLKNDISQANAPSVTLTPASIVLERTAATTGTSTLNYTYTRNTGTPVFTEIKIDGNGQTLYPGFSANGGNGSQSVTYPSNTTTTYTFTGTTGSLSSSATSTISYSSRRYWGRSAGAIPTQAEILAAAGGGSDLTQSKSKTSVITASGTNYPFFAYLSSLGTLTSIKDANNVEVLSGYNTGTLSLTNALGDVQIYRYYINQNATAGNTTMITQ